MLKIIDNVSDNKPRIKDVKEDETFIMDDNLYICVEVVERPNKEVWVECFDFSNRCIECFTEEDFERSVQLVDCELTVEKLTSLREEDK